MNELKERIDFYLELSKTIHADSIVYLKDTSVNIEDRWKILEDISGKGVLGQDSCGDGFINILDDNGSLYDDFNTDRYVTLTYKHMYETILEKKEEMNYTDDRILAWRESVLASGTDSFIYDW